MRYIYGYFIHSAVIDPVMFRWVNIYVQIKWPLLIMEFMKIMAFMVMFSWKKSHHQQFSQGIHRPWTISANTQ